MKKSIKQPGRISAVLLGCLLTFAGEWAGGAMAQSQSSQDPASGQVLNMRDADIRAFINDVSMLTGKTFVVDPRVQGKITVVSQESLNSEDIFALFLSTLRANGFTAISTADGTYRIMPEEGAAQDAVPMNDEYSGDYLITEVVRLRYIDVNTALQMIQPLINRQGRLVTTRGTNAVIIVDYASNVQRIRQVIANIDKDPSSMRVVTLRNASAVDMAKVVTDLAKGQGDPNNPLNSVTAVPLDGSNTLIMRGLPDILDRMAPIVEQLDAQGATGADTKVIYLKYASADELAPLLERISALNRGSAPKEGGGQPGRANIGVHSGTNALVISAPADVQRGIADVVRQLDIPRHQVLVEAIIVEISDTAAKQLGIQYILAGGKGSNIPFTATNFPSATTPNILAATGAVVVDRETSGEDSEGLEALQGLAIDSLLGAPGFLGGFAGQSSDGTIFGVILNALKRDTGSNVLSTPSIMTMDNQPASILVGREIPITTGEALGSANTNPFRTIERKDVGVKLAVKPQISEGGGIKLFINQEVSSILGPVNAASSELVTNKRLIETTVLVNDGQIVVLGGLIEDDEQASLDKVPILGDIPILGRAFQSEGKSRRRTNLMVFLRPTIITNDADMQAVTGRKYNYMQAEESRRYQKSPPKLDGLMNELLGAVPGSAASTQGQSTPAQ
jgi:general secretion pathway protein D